ncbi:MAG: chitobiase/beta-hexosaminidase C-terminal domain-containing protein, partial [Christensenellales bacterium]
MRKLKLILSTIFLTIAIICVSGGVPSAELNRVYATINNDASIDLGKYYENETQVETETYNTLTTKNLYVADNSDETKALYTVRTTNLASIDVGSSTGYTASFGSTINIKNISSINASKRLPWLSHSFKISDNLLKASKNGYLNVSVSANSKINNTKDYMRSVLYNGTLTGVADIEQKVYAMELIDKSDTAVDQTISLSNVEYADFLIVFAMNRGDGISRTVQMKVTNPTLYITSTDTTAPTVEFSTNTNWASSKTLTIKVTDNESGVMSVVSDNALTEISANENTQEKIYTMEMTSNGEYSVTVTDNVGNYHTYTYTENNIDVTVPNVEFRADTNWCNNKTLTIIATDSESGVNSVASDNPLILVSASADEKEKIYTMEMTSNGDYSVTVTDNAGNSKTYTYTENKIDNTTPNNLVITMPEISYSPIVNINASFVSDNLSPEKIYYTLDGTTPNTSSQNLVVGDNLINLPYGNITFKAVVIDETGLMGRIYTSNIKVDRHTLNLTAKNCDYVVTKPTTFDTDNGIQFYDGETVRLDFTAKTNCNRNVIKIDGVVQDLNEDSYEFLASGDIEIEVIYIYNLMLISCDTTYTYNPDTNRINPNFTLNTDENLSLDIVITCNGEVAIPKDVGLYTLSWSYNSYEFGGEGSFDFEIKPLDIYVYAEEDQSKIYGEDDPSNYLYTYSGLPASQELILSLGRADGENVGSYEITMISSNLNANYNIVFESQNFLIKA